MHLPVCPSIRPYARPSIHSYIRPLVQRSHQYRHWVPGYYISRSSLGIFVPGNLCTVHICVGRDRRSGETGSDLLWVAVEGWGCDLLATLSSTGCAWLIGIVVSGSVGIAEWDRGPAR